MKRLFIAGGLLGGLGLILACSEDPQDPAPPAPPRGGSTSAGTGGAAAGTSGSGGTGGDVGGSGGSSGSAGSGGSGGSPCATDCQALGQLCDANTAMCICPNFNPDHCAAANLCTDFIDDVEHCGNCDTVCGPVQACNAGACTVDPTEVYTTAAGCEKLITLLVGTTFYIMNVGTGAISSLPAAGGTETPLISGLTDPVSFAVDANSIYVVSGMTINRYPLAGGTAELVVTEATPIYDVAVQEDVLYYAVSTDVKSIPADEDDGTGTTVATAVDAGEPQSVAVDGTLVFWGAVVAQNVEVDLIDGDALIKLGASQGSMLVGAGSLKTDGTYVYWANGGSLARRAYDGGAGQETVGGTRDAGSITAFAVNATHGYYAADGNIEKAAMGTDPIWLARGQAAVTSMALDATSVYWATAECKIFKTAL